MMKNKPSINRNTAAIIDIFLFTDISTLLSATAAIKVQNDMIKTAIMTRRNNNTFTLIFLAASNVVSPGISNIVFRQKKTKKPIDSLIIIPIPAFLAHNRLDKDNS
jgi:hypothetical protein